MDANDTALTPKEEQTVNLPADPWADTFAKKVVLADFQSADTDRSSNHVQRWQTAQELYYAYQQSKTWEGTRIPRANIPVFTAFKQVESLIPRFMREFSDDPWFDVEPQPGTTLADALDARDFVANQFDDARGRAMCRRMFKSKLILGNGILEAGWKYCKEKRVKYEPNWYRQKQTVQHPTLGPIQLPTGPWKRKLKRVEREEVTDRPFLEYVSLKDFYVDPNVESTFCQDARYTVRRKLMTIDELLTYDEYDNFNIPGIDRLLELAAKKTISRGDDSKRQAEAVRGNTWNVRENGTSDPAGARLEVLRYCTRDRWVWLLEREDVIYNEPNDYEMIAFFNSVYTDVLDRFYGLSIPEVVEGDQRIIRGFLEARIDEASLSIHGQRIKKRGASVPAHQLRSRPGRVTEAENPKEDIVKEAVDNISQQFYLEGNLAEQRSQSTTGVTDIAVAGGAPAGGNSANRTAAGINVQASAVGERHNYLLEVDEEEVLMPIIDFFLKLDQTYIDPDERQTLNFLRDEKTVEMDSISLLNTRAKFRARGAARQRAKMNLQQVLPWLMQTVLNPELMQMLAQQQQKTVDVENLFMMALDAVDYRPRGTFLRPLSDQEKQAMNQPPPEETSKRQMQTERLASSSDNMEMQVYGRLMQEMLKIMAKQHEPKPEPKQIGTGS